jgi:hypothetical protein
LKEKNLWPFLFYSVSYRKVKQNSDVCHRGGEKKGAGSPIPITEKRYYYDFTRFDYLR